MIHWLFVKIPNVSEFISTLIYIKTVNKYDLWEREKFNLSHNLDLPTGLSALAALLLKTYLQDTNHLIGRSNCSKLVTCKSVNMLSKRDF